MTDSGTTVPPEQPADPAESAQAPPGYPRRPVPPPPPVGGSWPGPGGAGVTQAIPPPGSPGSPGSPGLPGAWVPPAPPPSSGAVWAPAPPPDQPPASPAGPGYPPGAAGYPPAQPGYGYPPGGSGAPSGGGYGSPAAGYGYPPGGQGYGSPGGSWGPPAGTSRPARPSVNLATVPPALLASMAISIAVALLFVANLFAALGQPAGTPGNERLLQFLSPADVAVAALVTLAIVLVGLAPAPPLSPVASTVPIGPTVTPGGLTPATVRLWAGVIAGVVAVAALIRAITALTISHQPGGIKVGNMFEALAAALVAGVAGWWALRTK